MTATIRLNGEEHRLEAATLADLLREEEIDPSRKGIAIALNGTVVPRRAWSSTALRPGDSVEIVKLFAGG